MTARLIALLSNRSLVHVSGEDARSFLQGILTQDVASVDAAGAGFSALLTPQGKILFDFLLVPFEDGYLLDCARESAPGLVKRVKMYKLRARVAVDMREDLAVAAAFPDDPAPERDASDDLTPRGFDGLAFPDPRLAALGVRLVARAPALEGTAREFTPASEGDYRARRIALGVPEFGADYGSEEAFLLDVNADALGGVNYKKGCFVGQEVTSRMKRKGAARRRTLIVEFDGPAPEKGAPVSADGATLGEITSAGDARALALIRLDRWEKAKTAAAAPKCDDRDVRLRLPPYLADG